MLFFRDGVANNPGALYKVRAWLAKCLVKLDKEVVADDPTWGDPNVRLRPLGNHSNPKLREKEIRRAVPGSAKGKQHISFGNASIAIARPTTTDNGNNNAGGQASPAQIYVLTSELSSNKGSNITPSDVSLPLLKAVVKKKFKIPTALEIHFGCTMFVYDDDADDETGTWEAVALDKDLHERLNDLYESDTTGQELTLDYRLGPIPRPVPA